MQRKNNKQNKMNVSWAKNQIESTNNFLCESNVAYILSWGLNLQIEHHLFPSVNHCHYHKLRPIVKKYCKENQITYNEYNTFKGLVYEVYKWFKKCGNENYVYVKTASNYCRPGLQAHS